MGALSEMQLERSRKNHAAILAGLARVGQVNVAAALGVHESKVSKMKSEGDLQQLSTLLAACGLKAVPIEMRCFDPKFVETLLWQAQQYLNRIGGIDQLEFHDE